MKKTTGLQRTLWTTVAFAEIGALAAFFLDGQGTIINDLSGGQNILFGTELLILAGVATYAALRKTVSKALIRFLIVLNSLLLIFLTTRLADSSVSNLTKELIAVDMLILLTLIVAQVMGIREANQRKQPTLTSAV